MTRRNCRVVSNPRPSPFAEAAASAAAIVPARGSSPASSSQRANFSGLHRASQSRADTPRSGFIRMSSGPSCLYENPRSGLSICIDDRPRSANTKSTPSLQAISSSAALQPGVVTPLHHQFLVAVSEVAQALLTAWQLYGIDVEAEQLPTRENLAKDGFAVTTVAKGRIRTTIAGLEIESLQDLVDKDGPVLTRRCLARVKDLGRWFPDPAADRAPCTSANSGADFSPSSARGAGTAFRFRKAASIR